MSQTGQPAIDLFRQAFDTVDEGIVILKRSNFKVVFANRKALKIYNLKMPEILDKTCHYVLFNKLGKCSDCPIARMYDSGIAQVRDVSYVDYRSFKRDLICRYTPLDEHYFVMSTQDQTKEKSLIATVTSQAKEMKAKNVVLKLRKQELEKKQEFLNGVLNGIKDGIMVVDPNYRVLHSNQMLHQLSSPQGNIEELPCYQLAYQRSTPCTDCPMKDGHLPDRFSVSARQIIDRETGDERNLTVQFSSIQNLLIETVRETTREKNLLTMIRDQQNQLARTNSELEEAQHHIDEELRQVGAIQQSLLPTQMPSNPHLDIASHYRSCDQAGGDYFDFIEFDDGHIGILVADVSGHGIPAAVIMAMTRVIQRSLAFNQPGPAATMDAVNAMLCENIHTNDFVTMFYVILARDGRSGTYSSAGHNPMLHLERQTDRIHRYSSKGFFLGAFDIGGYEEEDIQTQPGDLLFMYTDGINEAMNANREQFGYERIEDILREYADHSATDIIEAIQDAVEAFVGDCPLEDDLTMVVIRILEGDNDIATNIEHQGAPDAEDHQE